MRGRVEKWTCWDRTHHVCVFIWRPIHATLRRSGTTIWRSWHCHIFTSCWILCCPILLQCGQVAPQAAQKSKMCYISIQLNIVDFQIYHWVLLDEKPLGCVFPTGSLKTDHFLLGIWQTPPIPSSEALVPPFHCSVMGQISQKCVCLSARGAI